MGKVKIKELILRIPRFVASNILGTVCDLGVLFVLSEFVFSGYVETYLLSTYISFQCAVVVNFICYMFFVWRDRVSNMDAKNILRKFIAYDLSASGTFLIKLAFILILELIFDWNVMICNITALCFTGLINFSIGEWVIFRKR